MKDEMKDGFGIVEHEENGAWYWVQPGKFRLALGGPASLTYADRASAERDAEKIRAEDAKSDLTVVAATTATEEEKMDRVISLAEGKKGFEDAIWDRVNAFNKWQLSLGKPPATRDEIVKAVAHAVHYVLAYFDESDCVYGRPDDGGDTQCLDDWIFHGDEPDLEDRFIEELRECARFSELPDIKVGKLLQRKLRRQ